MSLFKPVFAILHMTARGKNVASGGWLALWCGVVLASGCSTAELTQRAVDTPGDRYYQGIRVDIVLNDTADTAYVMNRVLAELAQRDLRIVPSKEAPAMLIKEGPGTALLRVEEIDRQTKTVVYHRRYGRTALTQMRGRKLHDKPIITLRATLSDVTSGQTVFQADYVTHGPWYAEDAAVIATFAKPLVQQLEQAGFVAPRK